MHCTFFHIARAFGQELSCCFNVELVANFASKLRAKVLKAKFWWVFRR